MQLNGQIRYVVIGASDEKYPVHVLFNDKQTIEHFSVH